MIFSRLPTNFEGDTPVHIKGSFLNRLCAAVNRAQVHIGDGLGGEVSDNGTVIYADTPPPTGGGELSKYARITGHTLIAGSFYRWVYDITLVTRTPTYDETGVLTAYDVADVLDDESNPVTGKAVNDYEAAHTQDYAWLTDLSTLASGIEPMPLGSIVTYVGDPAVATATHSYDELVELRSMTSPDVEGADPFYVFARLGGFGGAC